MSDETVEKLNQLAAEIGAAVYGKDEVMGLPATDEVSADADTIGRTLYGQKAERDQRQTNDNKRREIAAMLAVMLDAIADAFADLEGTDPNLADTVEADAATADGGDHDGEFISGHGGYVLSKLDKIVRSLGRVGAALRKGGEHGLAFRTDIVRYAVGRLKRKILR